MRTSDLFKKQRSRGFTLLLAALVASIVLALGSSIFSIARKQVTLSSIGRDSQFAFYAADTGAECALYWDIRHDAFGSAVPLDTPECAGQVLAETVTSGSRTLAPYVIEFDLNLFANADGISGSSDDSGYCTEVTISKNTSAPYTVILANGYSTPCDAIESSSRALQRSVQLQY